MNKKELGKIKTSFIMISGFVSGIRLNSWGFGWDWSLILGFSFIIILWLGIMWIMKNIFGK